MGKLRELRFWFGWWKREGYSKSFLLKALTPNWYLNLSVYWSKREQQLQRAVASTHRKIGEALVTDEEFMAALPLQPGTYDVEELSIEGDMDGDTLIVKIKDTRSWQDKLYDEEGIIL